MKTKPKTLDRIIDAVSLITVLSGIGLYLFTRRVLTGIGAGTHEMPNDVSAVAVTDLYVAQSRMALWIVGVGVAIGISAAVRHRFRMQNAEW